jgi:hypothetical protein
MRQHSAVDNKDIKEEWCSMLSGCSVSGNTVITQPACCAHMALASIEACYHLIDRKDSDMRVMLVDKPRAPQVPQ